MKCRIAIISMFIFTLIFCMPLTAAALGGGYVPRAADVAVKMLDKQLMKLLADKHPRSSLRIAFTVPVNLNNFRKTNTLARQMSEELARGLKVKGYKIVEIRKGREIIMTPEIGEFFLTRDTAQLSAQSVQTELLLTGTYTISKRDVRFNIRLLHMASTEVIAMATSTVPIYRETAPLLIENELEIIPLPPLAPTTGTKLSP